ncbi:hydrolase, alpha/beta fold family [Hyphomonas neptunium ATCC 15444]|uniref:Hydrolase, alpha/beta fold family n=2 Tax=Hyphomonas TaxID=85 RepID=Q0BXG5_HYPNA|nr:MULTISPECIES: alpha/beta hydrolase [Hyphomonas]ABI78052.1 hydrolase, alpha/beta fold family [Hyphomonas neptunium ATCC 15444]KCZ89937.1 alpha/beta fold family hydrolase [Hyphomonas hirschiana VP5]
MSKDKNIVKDQPAEMPSEGGPLAEYGGALPSAPAWFRESVAVPYELGKVTVKGAEVTYQRWGKRGAPGLLFVHGNGAHAHWWDFIAPYFAEHYNVAALTFSGMGDSEWRETYDMDTFSLEEVAVAEAAGLFEGPRKPVIIAHSFGGFVTLVTGAKHGSRFEGMVIVDSPVNPPERPRGGPSRASRPHKVYSDLAAALARFRLAPPQLCENHYAMDYIARWSLKRAEGGWTWKFDPMIWTRFEPGLDPAEMLKAAQCRIAIIRGEESALMPDDVGDYMRGLLGHQVPFVSVPHARHHVMLDQPIAFISTLRMLLAEWDHSDPHRSVETSAPAS